MSKKLVAWILLAIIVVYATILIICGIITNYNLEKNYISYWNLADRSSTLQAKEQYISIFVNKIENNRNDFSEYNAIFLKTEQNKLDNNIKALITLRDRLKEIEGMNETDFAYQTAIQQITAQEQGEAEDMLNTIFGCWLLQNYPLLWGWILGTQIIILVGMGIVVIILFISADLGGDYFEFEKSKKQKRYDRDEDDY